VVTANPTVRRGRRRGLVAVAAAAALLLTACGSSGSNSSSGASELTVWHYFSDTNQVKVMTDYEAKFEKAHPGTTVTNVYVPYDQLISKLTAAAGSKSGPDVVVFNGADSGTLSLAGALAPLDQKWGAFADKSQFPASVVHKTNNAVYSVQGYVNLLGLWYNADLLKEVGVTPPTTIAELEAAMEKVKAAGKQGITLSALPQSQGEWQAFPWLSASGFDYTKPDQGALTSAFTMVRGWVDKGYLTQQAVTWDQTVPFQQFAAGNVAFAENGNWQAGTAASTAKFKYGVVPLPLGDTGKVYLGGEGEGIGAFSKNPDLAWQYLQDTYLSADGQLIAAKDVGSIPSRADAAKDPSITGNDLLKPFAETIAKYGANYPAEVIPAAGVAAVQLAVGQAWSAAVGGQQSPEDAAARAVTALSNAIK
jgi:multiple sugar transport system substrate-binding protein